MKVNYFVIDAGNSRSFPDKAALLAKAAERIDAADLIVVVGDKLSQHYASLSNWSNKCAVLLELGNECLGVHTGESRGEEGSNVLGFARFRLGNAEPSPLVELVRQPRSTPGAIEAATEFFEAIGLKVSVCADFSGRIVDRLVRPYFNAVLRRLDEGLASADDLDTTLRLGLGYPEGPISLLDRTGLADHCRVTRALFESYGDAAYVPARRAQVAAVREAAWDKSRG